MIHKITNIKIKYLPCTYSARRYQNSDVYYSKMLDIDDVSHMNIRWQIEGGCQKTKKAKFRGSFLLRIPSAVIIQERVFLSFVLFTLQTLISRACAFMKSIVCSGIPKVLNFRNGFCNTQGTASKIYFNKCVVPKIPQTEHRTRTF